jgi:hypothetical protein
MHGIIMFETNNWPHEDWPHEDKHYHRLHDHFKFNDQGACWRSIFQIDNFYRNPDEVRDYALSCETTTDKNKCGDMIGSRVYEKNFEMECNLKPVFEKLVKNDVWGKNLRQDGRGGFDATEWDKLWTNMPFICNITYGKDFAEREDSYNGKLVTYHKDHDKHRWAAVIYLNKPEECEGGTRFYEFKEDWPGFEPSEKDAFTIEMKYNTMILYEARHCHGAILNRDMFQTKPRLAQVFFM